MKFSSVWLCTFCFPPPFSHSFFLGNSVDAANIKSKTCLIPSTHRVDWPSTSSKRLFSLEFYLLFVEAESEKSVGESKCAACDKIIREINSFSPQNVYSNTSWQVFQEVLIHHMRVISPASRVPNPTKENSSANFASIA